jgi:hypothetical protein
VSPGRVPPQTHGGAGRDQQPGGGPGQHPRPDFEGTVIAVEGPWEEPRDIRPGRAILLGLYCAPLGLVFLLLAMLLVVPWILLRLLRLNLPSPFGLIFFLSWFRNPAPRTVPVRFFRLRDAGGTELQVRAKGHLTGGTADRQDHVAVWGPMRNGVLHLRRGLNERTHSWIRLRDDLPYGWIVAATLAWLLLIWAARR